MPLWSCFCWLLGFYKLAWLFLFGKGGEGAGQVVLQGGAHNWPARLGGVVIGLLHFTPNEFRTVEAC